MAIDADTLLALLGGEGAQAAVLVDLVRRVQALEANTPSGKPPTTLIVVTGNLDVSNNAPILPGDGTASGSNPDHGMTVKQAWDLTAATDAMAGGSPTFAPTDTVLNGAKIGDPGGGGLSGNAVYNGTHVYLVVIGS